MSNLPKKMNSALQKKRDEIAKSLPDRLDPDRFIKVALRSITKNEDLQRCSPESLYLAVLESGQLGLQPDGREAAIIRYGEHAELQPMVQGIINLMLRSPGVQKVESRVVREGDHFEYNYGLNPTLDHKPRATGSEGRELTHAYATCWRQGAGPTFEVMDREELEKARQQSKAPNSPAWRQWTSEMYRKVVLKRLSKYVDLSPEATRAIETDHWTNGGEELNGGSAHGPSDEYASRLTKERTEDRVKQLKGRMDNGGSETSEAEPNPSGGADEPEPDPPQASGAPEGEAEEPGPPSHEEAKETYLGVLRDYAEGSKQVNRLRTAVRTETDGFPDAENAWTTEHYIDAAGMLRKGGQGLVADLLGEDPAQEAMEGVEG